MDPFAVINALIDDLLFKHLDIFLGITLPLYYALATIVMVWWGIRCTLSGADGGAGFTLEGFARLVLFLSFGFALSTYYATPIPGIGYSLKGLIVAQTDAMADAIGQETLKEIVKTGKVFLTHMRLPFSALDVGGYLIYILTLLAIVVVEAAFYVVLLFGLVAQAVAILLGPFFVPWLIAPKLDWLFWNWLKFFLQYSFYQVVGQAVIYIVGNGYLLYLRSVMTGWGAVDALTMLPPFLLWTVIALFLVIKVPRLTSELFSGSSGSSAGILESTIGAGTAAATVAVSGAAKGLAA